MLEKLVHLDRRIIFLLVALAVVLPQLLPARLPVYASAPVRSIHDHIEGLESGTPILVSFDFDPSAKPELEPMARAILRHAFLKKLRVVTMGLWQPGRELAAQIVEEIARESNAVYGKDYCFLGWAPGNFVVIIGMGENLQKTFPQDFRGNKTEKLPILQGVRNLRDFPFVFTLSAGTPGIVEWILYGKDKYGFSLAGGCTAVTAPAMYNYYMTKQLLGLIGGMKGAAEYEALIDTPDSATDGMTPLSWMHFLVIALIVLSNVAYFAATTRHRRWRSGSR